MIALGAATRRFTGGGIVEEGKNDPIPVFRRYGVPLIFGLGVFFAYTNPLIMLAAIIGYASREWVGTGDMYAVLHGGYDGVRKYSYLNRWIYMVADKLIGKPIMHPNLGGGLDSQIAIHNAKWGFVFCTLRGTYKLITSGLLALVTLNPIVALYGLIGLTDGIIYFIAGRIAHKTGWKSVTMSELTTGGIYGAMVWLIIE